VPRPHSLLERNPSFFIVITKSRLKSIDQSIDMSKPSYRNASLGLLLSFSTSPQPLDFSFDLDLPAKIKKANVKHLKINRTFSLATLFRPPTLFGDTFSSPAPSLATFGDTFASTPASKNRFRNIPTRNLATCASGFGVTLPPPPSPPPKIAKKKNFRKESSQPSPPSPPLLIGNRREQSEKISSSDRKDPLSSGGP
jgi:hypothetical protein